MGNWPITMEKSETGPEYHENIEDFLTESCFKVYIFKDIWQEALSVLI